MAVVEGYYPTGWLVRLACERHLRDMQFGKERGLWFDAEAARRLFRFFARLKHTQGPFAGKPFALSPWQMFVIGSVFGWKRTDGARRFRWVYSSVGRKNGKSAMLSGVALNCLGPDGEAAAQVFSAATKRDQARVVFNESRRMVATSSFLSRKFKASANVIRHVNSFSEYRPLASDASTLDGLNPHFVVVDELHAHKNRDLWDVIASAVGARLQQLIWIITTAGHVHGVNSICLEKHEYSVKVLEGLIEDDAWFAYVAQIDELDDWRDPACYVKANPNLGVSISLDELIRQAKEAEHLPSAQAEFQRKRCNLWIAAVNRWFEGGLWDAGAAPIDPEELIGRPCFAALDLSSKTDLTAFTLLFPPEAEGESWKTLAWYFCPEKGIERRSRVDRAPYEDWAKRGFLIPTPGARVDYDVVLATIEEQRDRGFEIEAIAVDPWNAAGIEQKLMTRGFDVVEFRQGMRSYSGPSKDFEALVVSGDLQHGGNPITAWMAENVSVRVDDKENYMPYKASRTLRVDGVMTLVMATGLALNPPEGAPGWVLPAGYGGRA